MLLNATSAEWSARTGVVQTGAFEGVEQLATWLESAIDGHDLIVLPELSTTPFFSVSAERDWLAAGERTDGGPALSRLGAVARQTRTNLVVGFAERSEEGALHNSAAVIGRDGELVQGRWCTGPQAGRPTAAYRKVHLSENRNTDPGVHEKYFFRPGNGFAVFDLDIGRVAPLICYDRSFPESWRAVRRAGARIVVLPVASSRPERAAMFGLELRVAAMQHGVFVLAASKGGTETADAATAPVSYFGASRILAPGGAELAVAPGAAAPLLLTADLTGESVLAYDQSYHLTRDIRPDAY